MLVARRGRLLRRIQAGTRTLRASSAESCIWRARDLAVESLGRAGLERERAALQTADELDPLQALAAAEARSATGAAADALVYLADAIQVSRGGWFETYVGHPGAEPRRRRARSPPTSASSSRSPPASAAADAAGRPDAFDDGWDAERERQLAWLTERLDLDDL